MGKIEPCHLYPSTFHPFLWSRLVLTPLIQAIEERRECQEYKLVRIYLARSIGLIRFVDEQQQLNKTVDAGHYPEAMKILFGVMSLCTILGPTYLRSLKRAPSLTWLEHQQKALDATHDGSADETTRTETLLFLKAWDSAMHESY